MKIAVFLKIFPSLSSSRDKGLFSLSSEFSAGEADQNALEQALRWKEKDPLACIHLYCMAPESSRSFVKNLTARGADRAFLLSDPRFETADTQATAYILQQAVQKEEGEHGEYDAFFFGESSEDVGSGLVPYFFNHQKYQGQRPLISHVCELFMPTGTLANETLPYRRTPIPFFDVRQREKRLRVRFPACFLFIPHTQKPRLPNLRHLLAMPEHCVKIYRKDDLFEKMENAAYFSEVISPSRELVRTLAAPEKQCDFHEDVSSEGISEFLSHLERRNWIRRSL